MSSVIVGPSLIYSEFVQSTKHRQPGESFRDAMQRIAFALKDNDTHYHEFREILLDQRFLPAGRVQSAMGATGKQVTAYNCFVGGPIPDSFTKTDNEFNSSIMDRAKEGAQTMRMGGGLGNDFSTLRPKGTLIKTIGSATTGPIAFMNIFNEIGACTSSTGERRGAQMGILRIDHPDIEAFIKAKHDNKTLDRFNISVAITDEFLECLVRGKPFDLRFNGQVYKTIDPAQLWETLMWSTWDWAEPGVIFIDRINAMNNLWYCEDIAATNPCSEQPLPPHGACLLGSYNLVRYLRKHVDGIYYFDWDQFVTDIPIVTRAMDNIVDRALYPLPEQEFEATNKRRMGIGGTALANTVEAMGMPYGSKEAIEWEDRLCEVLTRKTYLASIELAKEKGAFPLFDAERYCSGVFIRTLDKDVQEEIKKHGIRNSHLISWAPTGSISMAADNVSSSLEPVYLWYQKRPIETVYGKVNADFYDYGFQELQVRGKRAGMNEVTVAEHVKVLTTAQKYTDSAVSKTINTTGKLPWNDFKNVYLDVYNNGGKGCTTFNIDGKRFGLFGKDNEANDLPFPEKMVGKIPHGSSSVESCTFDPATGRRTCE